MPPTIWLLGMQPAESKPLPWWQRLWRKIRPQTLPIGTLPDGAPVRLLQLAHSKAAFQALPLRQQKNELRRALRWLQKPSRQMQRLGLPLHLQRLLSPAERPPQLASGWPLAAREFVRQTAASLPGGLAGRQVAVLGVRRPWHQHICAALLQEQAQPVLYGPRALSLAEHYYQRDGIAIPVFGARKAIRSSEVILLLPEAAAPSFEAGKGARKAVFSFAEPMVQVTGSFAGRFGFGAFPAGQAAALLDKPLSYQPGGKFST